MKTKQTNPDFLEIDPHRLDEEWVNQPNLYYDYASHLADARQAYEDAKNNLELVRAELDKAIREDPEEFGVEKVTEKAVESAVILEDEYQAAQKQVNYSRHTMDVAQAAVGSLDHRKRALEKLVDLFLANYFSEPKRKSKEETTDIKQRGSKRRHKPL